MREALLQEKLADSRVRCNICQWRCSIAPGRAGVCGMYRNRDGVLFNMSYAKTSSVNADPIEKKPVFHFHPGSMCFSLGGWRCNFHCLHCQNWEISCPTDNEPWRNSRDIPPQTAIDLTKRYNCQGIAWTYNEPTMWFEYTLDSAKLAKANNLYTVYVTNGYISPEALDTIGPYLDVWRVDIKGFSDKFYQELAKVPRWRGILDVAERAKEKWRMHVEVITNIIPTMNDDDEQLNGIANWIKNDLGELTPWHVTRFYPQHNLMDVPITPVATIERAVAIGKKAGLKFIYAGNVPGHSSENTVCYSCGQLVVRRIGYDTHVVGLEGSKCQSCGAELNFRTAEEKAKRGKEKAK